MPDANGFPPQFLWGAATSAYQIEGFPLADGAGPSNWHRFAHTPGTIENGDTGDVACDHYRRYPEDVRLMSELGLTAYRFSIAWGRILPEGRGRVNPSGLGFYDRLIDLLLAHRIEPVTTLFHWDFPAALDDQGGWLNRDSAEWFAEYARVVVRALGDRVSFWITLNEPWVVMDGGYLRGVHAPGHRNPAEAAQASHNLLRAHGAGVQAIRAEGGRQAGLAVNLEPKYPASQDPADLAATRRADAYMNRQFLDPVFHGAYPDELAVIFGEAWTSHPTEDFLQIQQPLDFLGINYYTRSVVRHDPSVPLLRAGRVRQREHTYTATDWEVWPQSLTDVLTWVHQRYGPTPLYITENGAAFDDPPVASGPLVDDPARVAYLADHIRAAGAARAAGVDLRGYFVWSLLDNFEWSAGYTKRFGLVHLNYATQQRTPKASALFYRDVIASNGSVVMF